MRVLEFCALVKLGSRSKYSVLQLFFVRGESPAGLCAPWLIRRMPIECKLLLSAATTVRTHTFHLPLVIKYSLNRIPVQEDPEWFSLRFMFYVK